MTDIDIRKIDSHEEYYQCEQLQKEIWGFEDIAVVPNHLLITAQHHGGLLLGAFDGDQLVGFAFSFPGLEEARTKHCSLMCGVREGKRYEGLGFALKQRQRKEVAAKGLDLITWTFDPLQSLNGYFNLSKLGAISKTYLRNYYGDIRDELNQGATTDRLLAHWWITTSRVKARRDGINSSANSKLTINESNTANQVDEENSGLPRCRSYDLEVESGNLYIQVPQNIGKIRKADPGLASSWRTKTRKIFESYLDRGYAVCGFINRGESSFYRLRKIDDRALLGETNENTKT